jgi:hypothetical protein
MRSPRAYWAFVCAVVAFAVVPAARLQMKSDAASERIDHHLYGECQSITPTAAIKYCSFCKAESPFHLTRPTWENDDFVDDRSSSSEDPY